VNPTTAERVRALILSEIAGSLALFGETPETVAPDFDLRARGVIDSLGFLELVGTLSEEVGFELDFDGMDPDQLTVIGPLSQYVAEQSLAMAAAATEPA
jgi:acyl carrier protein